MAKSRVYLSVFLYSFLIYIKQILYLKEIFCFTNQSIQRSLRWLTDMHRLHSFRLRTFRHPFHRIHCCFLSLSIFRLFNRIQTTANPLFHIQMTVINSLLESQRVKWQTHLNQRSNVRVQGKSNSTF